MFNIASNYSLVLKDLSAYLLLNNIEKYVNGAILQAKRIELERKRYYKNFAKIGVKIPFPNDHSKIFLDAHFYFICIGQIDKNLKRLNIQLKNKKLISIHQEFQTMFMNEIRNDLEHIDARAVGKIGIKEKNVDIETRKKWMNDFVNFYDDKLSFGGKKYAINNDSIKKLRGFYFEIIKIMREDYAKKNPRFLELERSLKVSRSLSKSLPKILATFQK